MAVVGARALYGTNGEAVVCDMFTLGVVEAGALRTNEGRVAPIEDDAAPTAVLFCTFVTDPDAFMD